MPQVFIPPLLRALAGGQESVSVQGANLGEIIDSLDQQFPGMKAKLVEGTTLRPGIAAAIGSAAGRYSLNQPVASDSEVHFLPAIGGGR